MYTDNSLMKHPTEPTHNYNLYINLREGHATFICYYFRVIVSMSHDIQYITNLVGKIIVM